MTREEAVEKLKNIWIRDALQEDYDALDMAIEALKCVDDMVEYLTDSTVTWRDISDDLMKHIMEQHRFM